MKRLALLLALPVLVSAPAAARPRTEVTRFFLTPDVARAPVASSAANTSLQGRVYEDAVAAELNAQGFAPGGASARYVYSVTIDRTVQPGTQSRPRFSLGLGGASGGGGYYRGGSSVGGGVGIGFGGGRRESVFTRMVVQLRERGGSVVWEGRAETEDRRDSDEGATAQRLASALFRDFPGQNARTISVR